MFHQLSLGANEVNEFYCVALKHGGSDDGLPGLRRECDALSCGTFERDPDGNAIEAVTHSAPQEEGS